MVAFMVFVTGAAVSLAFFYLARGFGGFTPGFDRDTLARNGMATSFAVFCGAGPVLLVRALGSAERPSTLHTTLNVTFLTCLILLWTGALGVVAVESARVFL
ncbi:hypothetical protein [Oricola indica]|jgi:hypothetical protein|uniref:hypothetical protein n=1 Tax=Oricola indica TaxID=2872591 RepID=UPI001CBD4CB4|nr:hypothetical protein [Oricola indica]